MVKIGIFADTHIGRNIPRAIGDLRKKAFKNAFIQAINIFINEKVDYVIHAGDVFERRSMSPEDTVFVKNELQRLVDNLGDIKIFVLRGNHDGTIENNVLNYIEHPLAKYLKVVGEEALKGKHELYEEPGFALTGIGYTPYIANKLIEIKDIIKKAFLEKSNQNYKIFLIHAFIKDHHELPPGIPEHQKISLEILKEIGASFIVCGHYHLAKTQKLESENLLVLTPGGTEYIDLADKGIHGCYIAELSSSLSLSFKPIKPLHYIENIKVTSKEAIKPKDWFIDQSLKEAQSFLEKLKEEKHEGILRLVIEGIIDGNKYDLQFELEKKFKKIKEENPYFLYVELENRVKSLTKPIYLTSTTMKEEFLKEVFKPLGENRLPEVLSLIDEVDNLLDERASEKTHLLTNGDRKEFVKKWLKILEG